MASKNVFRFSSTMAFETVSPRRPPSPYQAVIHGIRHVIEKYELHDPAQVLEACKHLGQDVILPVLLGILSLVATYKVMKAIERLLFPPPPRARYQEAFELYQQGHVRPALKAFGKLQRQDKFAKATLSLAVHEIYVAGDAAAGMRILRKAKTLYNMQLPPKTVASIQEDAKAIQDGNASMVKMNARMAKQEYLGIATSG